MTEDYSNSETPITTVNTVATDYKAEVIVAGILEKGIHRKEICILRQGNAARGYSKDIGWIGTGYYLKNSKDYLGIGVNRKGFYDMLPEGLFHKARGLSLQRSRQEMVEEIREQRKEEQNARLFFRPLEVSASEVLVNAQLFERKLDKKHTNRNFSMLFSRYWPILELLPLDKAVLFIEIISVIPDLGHRLDFSAQIISSLLDLPVRIRMGKKYRTEIGREFGSYIGNMRLGINSIIGNRFESENSEILISLGPMSESQILYYNMDQKGRKIMEYLSAALLPADRQYSFKYIPLKAEAGFRLSSSYLGITTFINVKGKSNESTE